MFYFSLRAEIELPDKSLSRLFRVHAPAKQHAYGRLYARLDLLFPDAITITIHPA